ncbi:MAG: tetratricopeptide repeat protein [Myxococcales bacterium]|nr:tetratricopeptide repeat protein [Myxococcales bacterium]
MLDLLPYDFPFVDGEAKLTQVNLRAAFMGGMNSSINAQQIFTNRIDELTAFQISVQNLQDELKTSELSPVGDRTKGRRNVLSYYGVGGVGKTTLSLELERRHLLQGTKDKTKQTIAVRMDLAHPGIANIENFILRLRAGLGALGGHWYAFDLALAAYWARAHPGDQIHEFVNRTPVVRQVAKSVGLAEQMLASVEFFTSATLGGLPSFAHKAGMGLYRLVRDNVRNGNLLRECELFQELIEANPLHETLSFFPYLLAWDLEKYTKRTDKKVEVCIFIDTFEALGKQITTTEQFIQRCIYLMPNMLFVITGRNRIDWAESPTRGELDFIGQMRWPNLHSDNKSMEPRQHLVGYLSDEDAEAYLSTALIKAGESAIPSEVRKKIISGARGLPLYLDLSVSQCAAQLARNEPLSPDDYGEPFVSVAARVFSDLSPHERRLARTAALVDRFDEALLQAGCPKCPAGAIARFLKRPMLQRDDSCDLTYSLHLTLRAAINELEISSDDDWSGVKKTEVAQYLLEEVGRRAKDQNDYLINEQLLEMGFKLAGNYKVYDSWLVRVSQFLVEAGQWKNFGRLLFDIPGTLPFRSLSAALEGVYLRRTGQAKDAVDVLEEAARTATPNSEVWQLIRLHLAHALRNTGEYSRASEIYMGLIGSNFDTTARYWLCDFDYLQARYTSALDALRRLVLNDDAAEGERLRLLGHIFRVNAKFSEAIRYYEQAATLAAEKGLVAAETKALVNVAQTACWLGDVEVVEKAAKVAWELEDLVPNPVEKVKLRAAKSVLSILTGKYNEGRMSIQDTRELADEIHYTGGHNLADVAEILVEVIQENYKSAQALLQNLLQRTRASGGNTCWVSIANVWLEKDEASFGLPTIDWIDGANETLKRWRKIIEE